MNTLTLTIDDHDPIAIPAPPSSSFAAASLAVLTDRFGSVASARRTEGTFRHCGSSPTYSCTVAGHDVKVEAPDSDAWTWGALLAATAEDAESRGQLFAEQLTTFRRASGDLSAQINGRDVADDEFERFARLNRGDNTAASRADLAAHGVRVLDLRPHGRTRVQFAVRADQSFEGAARDVLRGFYGHDDFETVGRESGFVAFQSGADFPAVREPRAQFGSLPEALTIRLVGDTVQLLIPTEQGPAVAKFFAWCDSHRSGLERHYLGDGEFQMLTHPVEAVADFAELLHQAGFEVDISDDDMAAVRELSPFSFY